MNSSGWCALILLLAGAGCSPSGLQNAGGEGSERTIKGLVGRVAYSDQPGECSECQIMLCSQPRMEFPFLGPEEAKGEFNPNPVPVAFDPRQIKTALRAGDTVRFELLVDWNADKPLRIASLEFVKHGLPGIAAACPEDPE